MQEPYSESLANYADLESCDGDIAGEALTGALAGRLLSREIPLFGCRPCGQKGKATSTVALSQAASEPRRGRRPRARQETPRTRTWRLRRRLPRSGRPLGEGASRTPHAYVAEESERGGSTDERFEQGRATAGGESGGKQTAPRRTSNGHARTARSSGQPCPRGWRACGKQHDGRQRGGSPRCCHHLTPELLRSSFYALKRQAAAGVDGVSWREYESGLEDRLVDLDSRVQRGAYRAQPSRRVYILKPDGRQRRLGIAALEDKIVQQAVVTVLNCIYEERFLGFSYGFRPRRSAHGALDALTVGISRQRVRWVLDADIRGFFDNIGHEWMIPVPGARNRRPPHSAPDPQMVEGGSVGRRRVEGDPAGHAARGGDFTAAGKRVLALCSRLVGASLAEKVGERRGNTRAVRG